MSDSLQLHGLQPSGHLCPWGPPGRNTGVGGPPIPGGLPDQGSSVWLPRPLRWQMGPLPLAPPGKPVLTDSICGMRRWDDGLAQTPQPLHVMVSVASRSPDLPNLTSADFSVVGACDNCRKDVASTHSQPPRCRPGRAHPLGASPRCAGGSLPRGSLLSSPSFTAKPLILFFISFFIKPSFILVGSTIGFNFISVSIEISEHY